MIVVVMSVTHPEAGQAADQPDDAQDGEGRVEASGGFLDEGQDVGGRGADGETGHDHGAGAAGVQMLRGHVVQGGIDVRIEESAEEAPAGETEVEEPETLCRAHEREEGRSQDQAGTLDEHPFLGILCGPFVRQRAGQQDAGEGGGIGPQHGIEPRLRAGLAEVFLQESGNPGHVAGDDEDESAEPERDHQRGRGGEDGLETGPDGRLFRLGGLRARQVLEPERHHGRPDDSGAAEDVERVLPAQVVSDIAGQPAGQDDADVVGSLVDGHGPGAGVGVILAQQGIIGRPEEGFPAAGGHRAGEDEEEYPVGQAGQHRGDAPEQDAERADPFPAEPVAKPSSEGNHGRIEQVEEHGDQTHGGVRQAETVPDQRQDRVEDLAVSLVQEIGDP